MFIKVKYGDDETLLCNPSCVTVNLLLNIKRRTGYDDKAVVLDLSDKNGLIQELEARKYDRASDILASQGTYILVQKQALQFPSSDEHDSSAGTENDAKPAQYEYIPLLNNCLELFPDFKLQVQSNGLPQEKQKKKFKGKATSPAGMKVAKGEKKPQTRKR